MFWHVSVHPSICLSTGGGGTPARSRWEGVPWPGPDGGVPPPGPDRGVPWPGLDGGTRGGVSPLPQQVWGIPPPARWGWGYTRWGTPPPHGDGVTPPPPPVRTTEGVLATWRAVCLLRSRRRTALFNKDCTVPKLRYRITYIIEDQSLQKTHWYEESA